MLTYQWSLPENGDRKAILNIHGKGGWFGIKEFQFGDERIFRRGLFSGIDHRFIDPTTGSVIHLLMEQVGGSSTFRPALTIDGQALPETTGTPPPRVPDRPRSIAIVTGITYLSMLMALIMLQPISKILDAVYLRMDTRKLVLNAVEIDDGSMSATQPAPLRVRSEQLPPAREGQPYSANIVAEGGDPPYSFEPVRKRWPKVLLLDNQTGVITFVPPRALDVSGSVVVIDAAGTQAEGVFAIIVRPETPRDSDHPTILTERLPKATVGEEYRFDLQAAGGKPPYQWQTLRIDLPKALNLDKSAGVITGQVESPLDQVVAVRVVDSSYSASQDIWPWVLPVLTTAVCLLGYWSMRLWGVVLLGAVIVAELALRGTGLAPISTTAVCLQGVLLVLGLRHWQAMD